MPAMLPPAHLTRCILTTSFFVAVLVADIGFSEISGRPATIELAVADRAELARVSDLVDIEGVSGLTVRASASAVSVMCRYTSVVCRLLCPRYF